MKGIILMTNNPIPTGGRLRRIRLRLDDLLAEIESEDDPAFTPDQVNFLEKRIYEVRELLTDNEPADIDLYVHSLLAKHRKIAAIWCVEDVKQSRPDLTDEQAWEVLEQVRDIHDAEWGISWTTLETVADDLFPESRSSSKETRHGN
jgi:hypothetical protein